MKINNYGFIVRGPDYQPEIDTATLTSCRFKTRIIAVESLDQACLAADQLCVEGVQVIELCGGFSADDASVIRAHIQGAIPVGYMCFTEAEQLKLAALSDLAQFEQSPHR